jgi:hypothetical protein
MNKAISKSRDVGDCPDNGNDVRGVRLRFFPVVPGFLRAAHIGVAVRQGQEFEHHEGVWPRDANADLVFFSTRQSPRKGVPIGFVQSNRSANAGSRVYSVLNLDTKVFLSFVFRGCHELNPHCFVAVGNGFLELKIAGLGNGSVSERL